MCDGKAGFAYILALTCLQQWYSIGLKYKSFVNHSVLL